ncbi:Sas10/Utp3/C1D family protein [Serratia fonticola]
MRFRKKPVVIEAFQFLGESNLSPRVPEWFVDGVLNGLVKAHPDHIVIKTLEGDHRADTGDWIIRGVKGELYPCKPDIFAMTYESDSEPKDMGEVSDGYHTFNELYTHRVRLFTTLMRAHPDKSWFSHRNHEGIGEEGWILAGIDTPAGTVTYHLPVSEIPNLPPIFALDCGKEWDGHTPDDVLVRLLSLDGVSTSGLLPHQQRVTDELQELQGRLDKLAGFIAGDVFNTLPEQDQRLLEAQSHIMSAYVEVLTQRTKRF